MTDRTPTTLFDCTCLPLNRRLMAHLLKVDERSVHEQDCVERAVSEARAAGAPLGAEVERLRRIETAARRLPAPDLDARRRRYTIASDEPDFDALRAALEEPTPMGYVPASGDDSEPFR